MTTLKFSFNIFVRENNNKKNRNLVDEHAIEEKNAFWIRSGNYEHNTLQKPIMT